MATKRCGVLVAAVIALGVCERPAAAQPNPWGGKGQYILGTTLDCMGPMSMGGVQAVYRMTALGALGVVGTSDTTTLGAPGELTADVRGKGGLVLKGRISHGACGEGKLKLKMDGSLARFTGVLRFPGEKGRVQGIYAYDPADRYGVTLRLEFAAAKKGVIKPGKNAVLVAFVENTGPDTIPLGALLLRLRFGDDVGVQKVAVVKKLRKFDFGVDLDPGVPMSLVHMPVAVGEVLVLAIRFVPPDALAGRTLRADLDFVADPDQLGGVPPAWVPPATAFAEIDVEGAGDLKIRVKLRNEDSENVHIFLLDDPDPFSDRTRVAPGATKRLRLTAKPGQTFEFGAGRGGQIFDRCETGSAVKSGYGGVVEWNPRDYPSFLALGCPGGV